MAARIALAVVAVLVLAWSGILLRDLRVGQAAANRIFVDPKLSRTELNRELDRLQDAGFLNPGSEWEAQRALYLVQRGRTREARRAADALVRDEPANLNAWTIVLRAAQGRDPKRTAEALAAIRRLNPLVVRARR